ncbi:sorting nexin-29 isoform X3 [Cygnus atratus]|uniref:sorting nexin-29 isoform X3 n=1 Tax=Cygnus atratus TaxID=8868 RepID=UPI0021B6F8AB|nr:sorting nexin-29 isoform X3 [Cygnus atratus]
MSVSQNNDTKRQFLLERLLDAVKQCQIRFGGRKEIASDSDSRVTCLCAQFEAVLQHGLRRSRGLALTAAAIKQAAGFSSKTETDPVFWYYVKEVLNKHELQRFYSLKTITTDIGRGRAWLRCALNEHSLERYVHMLLADKNRLSVFYEDWSFMMDEERSSMIPTMAADLKSKKDRKKKKRVTNIISFDEEEDEQNVGDATKPLVTGESSEENLDKSSVFILPSSETSLGKSLNGNESNHSWKSNSVFMNGEYEYQKLDVKSIDDEDADEDELYGKTLGNKGTENETEPSEKPHEIVTCNSQICSWSPLQVLNDDSDVLFPVSAVGSYSQTDNLENGERHESGVHAVELIPRRSDHPYRVEVNPAAQVNTLSNMLPSATVPESMTINELRQAIVAMMNRKDELEEQNRSLRNLLDGEMEHSAALRQEMDNWRRKVAEQEERHATKVQALARENEVLKVQLKKYVGAVQMLRREGQTVEVLPNIWSTDGEFTIPDQKQVENNEELASSYERKLIEVAEMHGELIEFNERLHRALMAKEALVSQMRQELIDLRGPVPGDLSQTSEDQSLSDFEISNRALINVWIPSVFLRGKAANAFHVYQVYIRIKDDEWNVYRRYAEFRSLHHKLQNKYQQVRTFNFPPKKAIGNKDAKFVEERRKQLQNYLRNVMNKIIQTVPEFTANPKKETLIQLMPFFVDIPPSGEPVSKISRSRVTTRFPKLSRSHQREPRSLEPQSEPTTSHKPS